MSRAFARTGCNSPSAARMRSSLGSRTGVVCSEGRVVQIILISDRLAKARSVTLSLRHLVGSALLAVALLVAGTAALYWISLRYAAELRIPVLQQLVLAAQESEAERARSFVQQNLNAMAVKLGEMQAQLTRLDARGHRLPRRRRLARRQRRGGRGAVCRLPPAVRLRHRHRSRQRSGDAVCSPVQAVREGRRRPAARPPHRPHGQYRPLDRSAPAFRSPLPRRGAEPCEVSRSFQRRSAHAVAALPSGSAPGRDKILYFSGVVTPRPRVHEDHRLPPQAPRGSLERPDAAVRQP